jgi:hypothetical protein
MAGHGKIQRLLLAILRQHERKGSAKQRAKGLDVNRLTRMVDRKRHSELLKPVTSREESVRRALKALACEGAVLDIGAPHGDRSHWRINPLHRRRHGRP